MRTAPWAGPGRRFLAMGMDLLMIAGWAALAGLVAVVLHLTHAVPTAASGQDALAFLTLVLPVVLTFVRQEAGPSHATWGKHRLGMIVTDAAGRRPSTTQIVARNLVKFAPWQAAHTTVFHLLAGSTASWLLVTSIGAQLFVLLSALALVVDPQHRSLHDRLAGTRVARNAEG